jgi:hypothetical protein
MREGVVVIAGRKGRTEVRARSFAGSPLRMTTVGRTLGVR